MMNQRPLHIFISLLMLILLLPRTVYSKETVSFGVNWQFTVDLPEAGLSGTLKGYLEHIKDTNFCFEGSFTPQKSPVKTGPVKISSELRLEEGFISFKKLTVAIEKLGISIPELDMRNPNIIIQGNGKVFTNKKTAEFDNLTINVGNLPTITADLNYSPSQDGTLSLKVLYSLPLLQVIAAKFLGETASEWDKAGQLDLSIILKRINSSPEPNLMLSFENVSASSPDGLYLIDSFSGSLNSAIKLSRPQITASLDINSGEALFNTLYLNLNKHPLKASILSTLPDKKGTSSSTIDIKWEKMGNLELDTRIKSLKGKLNYSGKGFLHIPTLTTPFKSLLVDPFSLGELYTNGTLNLSCNFKGNIDETILDGVANIEHGGFHSAYLNSESITAKLPFSIMLDQSMTPKMSEKLEPPEHGYINIGKLDAGPLTLSNFRLPLAFSSNEIDFGTIPTINLDGGKIILSAVNMENPFSNDFALHGKVNVTDVDLLPLSPPSLPVDGKIDGDLEFWLLKNHLSTSGFFSGKVYDGDMKISEIFVQNPFAKSRQYGADFKVHNLKLTPLSEALDIGKITGRMNLDLTDLVIAYDQPAAFKLVAVSVPDSGSDQEISLKAVNTLSVIGTGSGLTGAGVGIFSQFFRQFSYAGLGLECTLDDDLFTIRGLIREDGIEYIIKKPLLFGINVINSNPKNLISFSDMVKRIKRIIE